MRILHAAAEFFPYIKVGGLSDMLSSLSQKQGEQHEIYAAVPLLEKFRNTVEFTGKTYPAISETAHFYSDTAQILKKSQFLEAKNGNVTMYFFENEYFSKINSIYANHDEHYGFAVFSAACFFLAKELNVDVIHSHDWHTALATVLHSMDGEGAASVFTIHNLSHQGDHPQYMTGFLRIDPFNLNLEILSNLNKVNYLKGALLAADEITTVSPGYRNEVLHEPAGCHLSWILRMREGAFTGILNGINPEEWNPKTDTKLYTNYTAQDCDEGKMKNKEMLYKEFQIPVSTERPLIGLIGRITHQKGYETFLSSFRQKNWLPFFYFFLGSGDTKLETELLNISHYENQRLCFYRGFDESLARKIEAASDFFLMPSLFEPCGLNQFYSHRYGSIPIVSRVGGLKDSVLETEQDEFFTGIVFEPGEDHSLNYALERACSLYYNYERISKIRKNIMQLDWSWSNSVKEYDAVYKRAIQKKKGL